LIALGPVIQDNIRQYLSGSTPDCRINIRLSGNRSGTVLVLFFRTILGHLCRYLSCRFNRG
jgi:hypothetical protein